ncbi:hypothetical protein TOT_010000736 [Theileria orientalis strain Shintoku]|uniref:Uncharacterized protein n=1 Tax=Theileria orientalis strain Shintoku TaxID=869250 RepID=J4CCF0_THEOR|nr:hypothetical protein TOT_010000736 [Theileria orientalis strain Shintoku]BAM39277.1 hypothetical protein TOT_010000736 [Theileria orientalis strain Shintoku]|eukprot:XP_009689578.1 hypothetical protein TOT_010000736 [Theileria orientalis strain Shintoku]
MTRKKALDRFSSMEGGKMFRIDSVSFAPKIEYGDSREITSKAISLLNNYIRMDRLRYLRFKEKKEGTLLYICTVNTYVSYGNKLCYCQFWNFMSGEHRSWVEYRGPVFPLISLSSFLTNFRYERANYTFPAPGTGLLSSSSIGLRNLCLSIHEILRGVLT